MGHGKVGNWNMLSADLGQAIISPKAKQGDIDGACVDYR